MANLLKAYDRSRVPLYLQVLSVMRRRIETGEWPAGHKIPTLVELEQEFHVARVTVRQAIQILCDEGLVSSQQGRGTFVAEKMPTRHWFKLATSWSELIASIRDNVPKRIKVTNPPRFPDLGEGEGLLARKYEFIRSIQYKGDDPYGIVNLHLAYDVFRRDPISFTRHTALPVLAEWKDLKIKHAHQTVVIGSADPTTAELLQTALGAPTAECRCVVIDGQGVAIYVADIIYRSEVIRLHIDLLSKSRG